MKKDAWKEYLSFSQRERVAVLILLAAIAVFVVFPFVYPLRPGSITITDLEQQEIAALEKNKNYNTAMLENNSGKGHTQPPAADRFELFYFDPNTLDAEGWKKLGVTDKTIQILFRYRNKGGQFKTAEDLRKIYSLPTATADRLIPYVKLETKTINNPKNGLPANPTDENLFKNSINNKHREQKIQTIDINTATAEQWKSLPGIGDVLSARIVKFRTSLKGFTSIDQVKKTYGLSDSVFQKIRPYLTVSIGKEKIATEEK